MTLRQTYSQFLASPTSALLSDAAALHYVPTLTSLHEPAAIIKHLAAQAKVLTKKGQTIIASTESSDSLSVEVDTTIEFTAGGGAYLPGLDDNFLADRIVNFPVVHIVQFDSQGKIHQVRMYWDQASILKSIEVIGSRGRNWPIRDGQDQLKLIANSISIDAHASAASRRSTTSQGSNKSHASSVSATADPHASLSLFQPREIPEETTPRKNSASVATRMSAKPPTRNLADMLAGHGEDHVPGSPSDRPVSPRKNSNGGASKAGAGKSYHPIRLFDENDEKDVLSPEKTTVKTNPNKFEHFQFGNGEGAVASKIQSRAKHASQWDFADFATPSKPKSKIPPQQQRHFGWSDDEEEAQKSPVRREVVHHERPTSKAHFEFTDAATPAKDQKRPGSQHVNNNMGLYTDNVTDNTPTNAKKQPLTTNPNVENRKKDFNPHFAMTDTSSPAEVSGLKADQNQAQVIKGMSSQWDTYDESPAAKKENRGIKLGGNGMGGRKGVTSNWAFGGDEDAKEEAEHEQRSGRIAAQQKAAAAAGTVSNKKSDFWDF